MFQILSLSGGGYLGLYSAAVLAEVEHRAKGPIASHFDLLAGTWHHCARTVGRNQPAAPSIELFQSGRC